jgi:hypothetical protein
VKQRLNTDATGHDEGNAILIRSLHSCTRAPSLSKRSWIVSIVAQAQVVYEGTMEISTLMGYPLSFFA